MFRMAFTAPDFKWPPGCPCAGLALRPMRVQTAFYNGRMFVHLRLHTEFSVVDGTNRIGEAVKTAARHGQPALAVTDLNNLFGAVKFYRAARGKGVKPILGAEVLIEGLGSEPGTVSRIVLL